MLLPKRNLQGNRLWIYICRQWEKWRLIDLTTWALGLIKFFERCKDTYMLGRLKGYWEDS